MIDITDYTTYADVRAILGVDSTEITDTTLGLSIYASALQRALRASSDSDGKTLYEYYAELSVAETLTEEEDTLFGLLKEFSAYTVAVACLPGLSISLKKTESDGKALMTRFSPEELFLNLSETVTQTWNNILASIMSTLGVSTEYNSIKYLARIAPDTDVVTE